MEARSKNTLMVVPTAKRTELLQQGLRLVEAPTPGEYVDVDITRIEPIFDNTLVRVAKGDLVSVAYYYAGQGLRVSIVNDFSGVGEQSISRRSNLEESLIPVDDKIVRSNNVSIVLDEQIEPVTPHKIQVISVDPPGDKWERVLGAAIGSDVVVAPIRKFDVELYCILSEFPGRFNTIILITDNVEEEAAGMNLGIPPTRRLNKNVEKPVPPEVICLKGKKDVLGPSLERAPENYVYIGRNMNMGGWRLPKSKWANPYSVKQYGRDQVLVMYRDHILQSPDLLKSLSELEGKILACWCAPEPCHGDILREMFLART